MAWTPSVWPTLSSRRSKPVPPSAQHQEQRTESRSRSKATKSIIWPKCCSVRRFWLQQNRDLNCCVTPPYLSELLAVLQKSISYLGNTSRAWRRLQSSAARSRSQMCKECSALSAHGGFGSGTGPARATVRPGCLQGLQFTQIIILLQVFIFHKNKKLNEPLYIILLWFFFWKLMLKHWML